MGIARNGPSCSPRLSICSISEPAGAFRTGISYMKGYSTTYIPEQVALVGSVFPRLVYLYLVNFHHSVVSFIYEAFHPSKFIVGITPHFEAPFTTMNQIS